MVTFNFGSVIIEMKNPEMGNQDSLEFIRVSRSTTGGDTIVYRDTEWPKIEKLNVIFDSCDFDIMERMKQFIQITLGKEFTYEDQDGITWNALIVNPNTAIKQSRINGYVVALELEAEET